MPRIGLLRLLFENPVIFFIVAIGLIIAVTIHEFAHAFIADKLGDPTPKYQGRVTLDPRAHLDPMGTLAILIIGFGWGKPVQFDPYNLKNPKKDAALISLAGPASNIILATILSLLIGLIGIHGGLRDALIWIIGVNIMLAIFNLIPIAPLDGSKIANALLPKHLALEYEMFMNKYGTLVLIGLILPWNGASSPISHLISPAISFVMSILSNLWFI